MTRLNNNIKSGIASIIILMIVAIPTSSAMATVHSDIGCSYCHVPHQATGDGSDNINEQVPLWNPGQSSTSLTGNYINTNNSLNATMNAPDGASKLCLSCHDGTIFMSSEHTFGPDEDQKMGTLSYSHPISFVYDDALVIADQGDKPSPELVAPSELELDILDGNNKMQCTSCHDIHSQAVDNDRFLRWVEYDTSVAGATGDFCRHCHIK